ncbi:MAG: YifB family Mg chelatase-like AAA ATPase [Pseudomonadota bacterium]
MVSAVRSVAFWGVDARPVTVECALSPGLPAFGLVGLPDKAISESKERVRAALTAVGLALPPQRITINLSPADLPKTGSHFDLPIALALMAALNVISDEDLRRYVALGELGLDGRLRPVQGALPAALMAAEHDQGLICPSECGAEAAWVGACEVLAPQGLVDLMNHFSGRCPLTAPAPEPVATRSTDADLIDVKGQDSARRAIEVAAAGGHHILMVGEPGSGKSMLARRITSILPPLTPAEALEVATVQSLAGEAGGAAHLTRERPYRAPHHSASRPALTGGGPQARPGEISLAHRGVLFLDELPEFDRSVLESLRQPMETGEITVSRAAAHVSYPARFLLVAAMNPCRCGYLTDPSRACSRAPRCGADYMARLSGPLMDRFDIRIEMPPVTPDVLALQPHGDGSARVGRRVAEARAMQTSRVNGHGSSCNAELEGAQLDQVATPDAPGREILMAAAERYRLSARGYHRVLRVARTCADLDGATAVGRAHVAEAVSYRRLFG